MRSACRAVLGGGRKQTQQQSHKSAASRSAKGHLNAGDHWKDPHLLPHEMRIGIISATMGVLLRNADASITGIIMRTCRQKPMQATAHSQIETPPIGHRTALAQCAGSAGSAQISAVTAALAHSFLTSTQQPYVLAINHTHKHILRAPVPRM